MTRKHHSSSSLCPPSIARYRGLLPSCRWDLHTNQTLRNEPISIFRDGEQQRGCTYVGDISLDVAQAPLGEAARNCQWRRNGDHFCGTKGTSPRNVDHGHWLSVGCCDRRGISVICVPRFLFRQIFLTRHPSTRRFDWRIRLPSSRSALSETTNLVARRQQLPAGNAIWVVAPCPQLSGFARRVKQIRDLHILGLVSWVCDTGRGVCMWIGVAVFSTGSKRVMGRGSTPPIAIVESPLSIFGC